MHTEADRMAFHKDKEINEYNARVTKWLSDNPTIGQLSSGKFYTYSNGRYVEMTPPFAKP